MARFICPNCEYVYDETVGDPREGWPPGTAFDDVDVYRPLAKVALSVDGEIREVEALGDGPVDAVFAAIEQRVGTGAKLLLYSVNAITTGTDAQGEVTVRLSKDGRVVNGLGADTDIVIASAKAYLNAVNRLEVPIGRAHPQHAEFVTTP